MWTLTGLWQSRGFLGKKHRKTQDRCWKKMNAYKHVCTRSSSSLCFVPQVWLLRLFDARGSPPLVLQSIRLFNRGTDLSVRLWRGDGVHQHQRHHGPPHAAERRSGGWTLKKQKAGNWLGSHGLQTNLSVLLYQVVLLTSSEDPVSKALAEKLSSRMGCEVFPVGEEPLCDLEPLVERRKLQWNDVAYIGKQLHLIEHGAGCHWQECCWHKVFIPTHQASVRHVLSLFTSQVTINQTSNFCIRRAWAQCPEMLRQ